MLAQLTIRDIVLIDRLDLQFGSGMTVLTGETGAGKSILLDALMLAIGGRGDGGLVRHGEKQGQVTAVFDIAPTHPAWSLAREAGIEPDGELILRRVQLADGRTRAFLNDSPVSAQVLRDLGRSLVEIHGQHDDRALVDPAAHRALLDAFGGLDADTAAVGRAFAAHRSAIAALAAEEARIAQARTDADYMRHTHDELSSLGVQPGEEVALSGQRTTMMQAAKVVQDLREAHESIAGDGSPMSTFSATMRRLERRAGQAPDLVEPCIKAIDAVLVALDGAEASLDHALREAAFEPQELERVEERLFAVRAAARKYHVEADALGSLADTFAAKLAALDADEVRLSQLAADVRQRKAEYRLAAERLSTARAGTAARLSAAVAQELAPLKLGQARFDARIETAPQLESPDGYDRVEFWVATNPGSRPGPLTKVASGGELARFMLALKVVLAERGSAPTLVFDEIDTGVGGAVADAIGQRLARLAAGVQVLTVTHAPQVAARSGSHLRISKTEAGDRVATRVSTLEPGARREEIARMLAGATITDEARAAAQRLMEVGG